MKKPLDSEEKTKDRRSREGRIMESLRRWNDKNLVKVKFLG